MFMFPLKNSARKGLSKCNDLPLLYQVWLTQTTMNEWVKPTPKTAADQAGPLLLSEIS